MSKIIAALPVVLGAAVADDGAMTLPYPAGYVQANFTGAYAAANAAYLLLNDNDRFEEADDDFDISYGSSTVTVTNKTGVSWPIGTKVLVGLAQSEPTNYVGPKSAAITKPTGGSTTDAEARAAIDSLIDAVKAAGITL